MIFETVIKLVYKVSIVVVFVLIIIGIFIGSREYTKQFENPQDKIISIDSVAKDNEKLILDINNLEEAKNVEIIQVNHLDNDSTVKLFYKLIRE